VAAWLTKAFVSASFFLRQTLIAWALSLIALPALRTAAVRSFSEVLMSEDFLMIDIMAVFRFSSSDLIVSSSWIR
jgi:hypothetical protein